MDFNFQFPLFLITIKPIKNMNIHNAQKQLGEIKQLLQARVAKQTDVEPLCMYNLASALIASHTYRRCTRREY